MQEFVPPVLGNFQYLVVLPSRVQQPLSSTQTTTEHRLYLGGAVHRILLPPYQGECKLVDRERSVIRGGDHTAGALHPCGHLNDTVVACPVLCNRLSPYNGIIA